MIFKTFDDYLLKNLKPIIARLEVLEKTVKSACSEDPTLSDVIDASIDDGVLTVTLGNGNTKSILLREKNS